MKKKKNEKGKGKVVRRNKFKRLIFLNGFMNCQWKQKKDPNRSFNVKKKKKNVYNKKQFG